jgi:Uma2 family endonuclease
MTATTEPVGLPPRPLTVADLEGMPDDGHRYELIDGVLIVSPAPRLLHQRAVVELVVRLHARVAQSLEVIVAPFAVRPDGQLPLFNQQTELQPDILVALRSALSEKDLPSAPLLAVEVLSPSTRMVDLTLKKAAYERMGTASFWVVDPDVPDVRVFELDDAHGAPAEYRLVAQVAGNDVLDVVRPFPLRLRPADLISEHRP